MSLATRSNAPERMATDCADYEDYRRCLRDLSRVNRVTLTHRPTLRWLAAQGLRAGDRFSLIDVASGYGDMLRAIRRWSRERGLDAVLTGVDLNPWAIRAAREATPEQDGIAYVNADVFAYRPPEPVDFIISAQFAHHLTDAQVVHFIGWMERTARRGWIVSDLKRSGLAWAGFAVLATVAGWHRFVRSDGMISILRGFRPAELEDCARRAGLADVVTLRPYAPSRLLMERRR